MRLHVKAGTLLAAAAVIAGCTGVPGRQTEALDIKQRIAAMPGVSDVDLVYDNGILEGTRFELRVDMAEATNDQIGAAAAEINAARGEDFEEYDQRVEIDVADGVGLGSSKALAEDSGDVAALLRELDSRVTAQSIDWRSSSRDNTAIDINYAEATGTVVDTVLEVFADRPIDEIEVMPTTRPSDDPVWRVFTRLTVEQKRRIDAQLVAANPSIPTSMNIRDGDVVHLNVRVPSPETAYTDIVRVIAALGAGPQHPLQLGWSWADDPARYGDLRWSGSVDIGNCDDPNANTGSADDLVPAARRLQQRIRDEYGPCPK